MVPKTDDRRVLFAIPWRHRVLIGTTETAVPEAQIEPRPLREEIDFLLHHAARYLTQDPRPKDVLSAFAGLRPLVKTSNARNSALVPRDHALTVSPAGLVTIGGGKWTTYRKMAEDTVDAASEVGGLPRRVCPTTKLPLHGCPEEAPSARGGGRKSRLTAPSTHSDQGQWQEYGTDAAGLRAVWEENPSWRELLHPELPHRVAEIIWAVRHEMARTVEDVLARRIRLLLLDTRASMERAPTVAKWMAAELGRDIQWQQEQVTAFRKLAEGYLVPG